jgi:rSAM/selenodomain-associated transferase 1
MAASMEEFAPFVAFSPVDSRPIFEKIVPKGVSLIPQTGGDLGPVMSGLIDTLTGRHHKGVIVIGSDIPLLQPHTLRRALQILKSSDVCIGPAADGGYYLVGANRSISPVFQDIPWSTSQVLKITAQRAQAAGLSVGFLEELSDVDTAGDLKLLEAGIQALCKVPGSSIPRMTQAWLATGGLNSK